VTMGSGVRWGSGVVAVRWVVLDERLGGFPEGGGGGRW
jgi:hypothetical protein